MNSVDDPNQIGDRGPSLLGTLCLLGALLAVDGAVYFALDSVSRVVLLRTIALGLCASLIAIPLGSVMAWICLTRSSIARVLLVVAIALLLLPMIIHVSSWDAAFGKLGWLTSVRGQVLEPIVSGWGATIWIHGIAAVPQVALLFLLFAWADRREYEQQALLDGTRRQIFWRITLPRYIPIILAATLWIVVSCAREISVTDLYQVGTLAEQVYLGYSLNNGTVLGVWAQDPLTEANNLDYRLTWLTVGLLFATSLVLLLHLLTLRTEDIEPAQADRPSASRSQWWLGGIVLLIVAAVPIANVCLRACFFVEEVEGQAVASYRLSQLPQAIARACVDYQDEFVWSAIISAITSSVMILVSIAFVQFARASWIGKAIFAVLLALSLALPGPVIGETLASGFSSLEGEFWIWLIDYTVFGPVVASSIFCWPIAGILIWMLFRRMPQTAIENARLEGAGAWRRLWVFGISANRMALAGAWLILFAVSYGELSASQMVRPAGMDTVARKMLGDLHAGVNELTAGITIVTTIVVIGLSCIGWCFVGLNHSAGGRK